MAFWGSPRYLRFPFRCFITRSPEFQFSAQLAFFFLGGGTDKAVVGPRKRIKREEGDGA